MLVVCRILMLVLLVAVFWGCGAPDRPASSGDSPSNDGATVEEGDEPSGEPPVGAVEDANNERARKDPPDASRPDDAARKETVSASTQVSRGPVAGPLPAEAQWKSWGESLMAGSPEQRRAAAEAIAQCLDRLAPESVAGLLGQESVHIRRGAAFYLLDRLDPNDPSAAAAMTEALADDDATVRHIALSAIRRLPASSLASAVPQLVTMLAPEREDATNRAAVVRLLASLESRGVAALPRLVELLHGDPDTSVRSAAAAAIPRIAAAERAAAELQQALAKESDVGVQGVLVTRLGKLGPAAAGAVEALAETLETENHELQRKAIDAMIAIGKPSVPRLIAALESPDVQVRRLAVFALGSLSAVAAEATEPLKARLNDEDEQVRQLATVALLRIQAGR